MKNGKLDEKIAELSAQIEVEQARYKAAVAAAVQEVLKHYGISIDVLNELVTAPAKKTAAKKAAPAKKAIKGKGKRKPAFKGPQPPKYADPATGATWSGFGKAPSWIAAAPDRTPFLITSP